MRARSVFGSVPTTLASSVLPSCRGDGHGFGVVDHMVIGDNVAVGRNEEAGAFAHHHRMAGLRHGSAVGQAAKLLEELLDFRGEIVHLAGNIGVGVGVFGGNLDLDRHDGRFDPIDERREGRGVLRQIRGGNRRCISGMARGKRALAHGAGDGERGDCDGGEDSVAASPRVHEMGERHQDLRIVSLLGHQCAASRRHNEPARLSGNWLAHYDFSRKRGGLDRAMAKSLAPTLRRQSSAGVWMTSL